MINTLNINGKRVVLSEDREHIEIITPINLEFRLEDGVIIFEEI